MSDDQVKQALSALAEHDRSEAAPAFIEARVLAAYRAQRKRAVWPWALGIAAAAALVIFAAWLRPEPPAQVTAPLVLEPELQQRDVFAEAPPVPVPAPPRRARPQAIAAAPAAPREVVTEFFPLMDVMPPIEYGQVYRVTVPASTMRVAGIPVSREMWSQRVEAEVLVGEEGLARAIRFVGYEQ